MTNHAVVAMVGEDVKQTRCTTCEADHEYKHAKVPRQRLKTETPAALYAQVLANGPKRVAHEGAASNGTDGRDTPEVASPEAAVEANEPIDAPGLAAAAPADEDPRVADAGVSDPDHEGEDREEEEGPVHRPLIRASLPRQEGQQPPARPIPEFTIRQPGGRPNRFRPRHQRGGGGGAGQQFPGNRSNGNMHGGPPRGGMRSTGGSGRPPQGGMPSRLAGRRHGPGGRKRSK